MSSLGGDCRPGKRVLSWSTVVSVSSDRKSTRLNSSHANISYAVFCLKKKIFLLRAHPGPRSPHDGAPDRVAVVARSPGYHALSHIRQCPTGDVYTSYSHTCRLRPRHC